MPSPWLRLRPPVGPQRPWRRRRWLYPGAVLTAFLAAPARRTRGGRWRGAVARGWPAPWARVPSPPWHVSSCFFRPWRWCRLLRRAERRQRLGPHPPARLAVPPGPPLTLATGGRGGGGGGGGGRPDGRAWGRGAGGAAGAVTAPCARRASRPGPGRLLVLRSRRPSPSRAEGVWPARRMATSARALGPGTGDPPPWPPPASPSPAAGGAGRGAQGGRAPRPRGDPGPLCLLIGALSPLTFKVIIDRYVLIAILNLCFFQLIFKNFFFSFSYCLMILFLVCLSSLLFGFCDSIVNF